MGKLGKVEATERGFPIINFVDVNEHACSLQLSSAVVVYNSKGESDQSGFIWLGVNDAEPKVMAVDAKRLGVETSETVGWVPYPIPDEVHLSTRMHLNREQALALGRALLKWAKRDEF